MAEIGELKNLKEESKSEEGHFKNLEGEVPTNNAKGDGEDGLPADNNKKAVVELLPPEMWEKIFLNLESPKDVLSCWNAAATWAWPAALQSTKLHFKMAFPIVLRYLNQSDLLRCSAVSKFLNIIVYVCIQEAEDFWSSSRLARYQRVKLRQGSDNMSDFIDRFNLWTASDSNQTNVPVNPVVYRRVVAEIRAHFYTRDEMEADRRNLLKCLHHHGHLIHHLHLDMSRHTNIVGSANKAKFVQKCLKLSPNLRVLHISTTYEDTDLHRVLQDLRVHGSKNQWPELDHLKILKFDYNYSNVLWNIANAYASQLLCLNFGCRVELVPPPNRFSCLQKVVYNLIDYNCRDLETFMRSNKPPLKQLTIAMLCASEKMTAKNWNRLTTAVNTVSGTLETLVFRPEVFSRNWAIMESFDLTKFEGLRLPKLKDFQLSTLRFPSVDILHNVCPALQQLTVILTDVDGEEKKAGEYGKRIDVYSKHQFWSKMAHIQTVDLKCVSDFDLVWVNNTPTSIPKGTEPSRYTRHGYEAKFQKHHILGVHDQSLPSNMKKSAGVKGPGVKIRVLKSVVNLKRMHPTAAKIVVGVYKKDKFHCHCIVSHIHTNISVTSFKIFSNFKVLPCYVTVLLQ